MAVALHSGTAGTGSSGGSTSITFAYSNSSGSDRLLLVQTRVSGAAVSAVSYAGAALTNAGSGGNMVMWRKTAPATGSNNIQITLGTYNTVLYSVSSWTGVDQTTPLGTAGTGSGTNSTGATSSITCPPDGAIWGGIEFGYSVSPGTITAGSGTTLLGWVRNGANGWRKAGGYRFDTGTLSFNSTNSAAYSAQGFPINPSVSFTANLPKVYSQAVKGSVI